MNKPNIKFQDFGDFKAFCVSSIGLYPSQIIRHAADNFHCYSLENTDHFTQRSPFFCVSIRRFLRSIVTSGQLPFLVRNYLSDNFIYPSLDGNSAYVGYWLDTNWPASEYPIRVPSIHLNQRVIQLSRYKEDKEAWIKFLEDHIYHVENFY